MTLDYATVVPIGINPADQQTTYLYIDDKDSKATATLILSASGYRDCSTPSVILPHPAKGSVRRYVWRVVRHERNLWQRAVHLVSRFRYLLRLAVEKLVEKLLQVRLEAVVEAGMAVTVLLSYCSALVAAVGDND
ncbi:hypothetical protein Moror_15229 [Moniliophthora roreri MCA 2997]|uniref:Uncharacterized protein n=2 Tax=Moniliophthora roreri TaxID=221103 RepID=V2Y8A9_MONRO|nr:hypothetical protein Moror_15229 [Moniliophthora roreri MCA 2997]